MKRLLLVFCLLLSFNYSFSCSCVYDFVNTYMSSENVFKAKVIEISKYNNSSEHNKKATLQILHTYKGKPTNEVITSKKGCSIQFVKINSEWIFFTNSNNGIQLLSSCNPSFNLSPNKYVKKNKEKLKEWSVNIQEKLQIIHLLSMNIDEGYTHPPIIRNSSRNLFIDLASKNLNEFQSNFGLYFIYFNSDKTVKNIEIIQSLGQKIDKKVNDYYIKRRLWN